MSTNDTFSLTCMMIDTPCVADCGGGSKKKKCCKKYKKKGKTNCKRCPKL